MPIPMLKIRHLHTQDYRVMPWKNHRGVTSQVAIQPEGANFPDDPFIWRVSTASIASSGPFSTFPGYDRIVVLIEGQEAELNHDMADRPRKLTRLEPYAFRGEWETTCELTTEAIRDFGILVRRDQAQAKVTSHPLTPRGHAESLEHETLLYYCVRGHLEITIESSGPKQVFRLRADEMLWIENPTKERATLDARLLSGPAELLRVEIRTTPTQSPPQSR